MKVLITDDHPIVRKGIRQILEDEQFKRFNEIDEAGNGRELLEKITISNYDIILLDISMPGRSGLDLINDIKKIRPAACIVILSIYQEEQYAIRAFKLGASGYLTKDSAPAELLSALGKVLSGERYIPSVLAEKITFDLIDQKDSSQHHDLSVREMQVMQLLASGKTITGIASELSLSPKTISTYKERIMDKLKLSSTSDIIRYALREGLVKTCLICATIDLFCPYSM
jgi:two-component system, NarL family, invasion response regulator UvrY